MRNGWRRVQSFRRRSAEGLTPSSHRPGKPPHGETTAPEAIPCPLSICIRMQIRSNGIDVTSGFDNSGKRDRYAAAERTTLGVVIGTSVQAWDADLDALAVPRSATSSSARSTAGLSHQAMQS